MKNNEETSTDLKPFSDYLIKAQYLIDHGFIHDNRSAHEIAEQMQRNDEEKGRKN